MSFFDSVISGYLRCLDFKGRSSRSEFWWFFLFSIMLCLLVLNFTAGDLENKLSSLNEENFFQVFFNSSIGYAILVTAIPQISLSIRRFHDIGKSGWWYFALQIIPIFLPQSLGFLSIFTLFAYIYFMCEVGGPNNAYGQNPLAKENKN